MLKVTDLTVARGGTPLLSGVSFDVAGGNALVLRGPNGAGKTTLLRTIAGLQPPVAGQIEVDEDAIAYAAHADGIKAGLTVAENLNFWAEVFGTKDVSGAINRFELTELSDRLAGRLSAGQKRRLGLARLLVTGRPLWILDEPTVSLDAFSVRRFAEVVKDHLRSGGAALMATHIDLGLDTEILDISRFSAVPDTLDQDEAFL